ncbi:MAG: hypothetical protein SNJ60_04395 [Pseudanabaenaceae cyanobacterium]
MSEINLVVSPDTDPWLRLAVGSPWDGFALDEEIPLPVAAQAFDGQQPAHNAALAFLQAEIESQDWFDVLAADGVTQVRDLFGNGVTPERQRILQWLEEQLPVPARERFARYWYGREEAPTERPASAAHWLEAARQTWDPTHPPHQAALNYLGGALRERGLGSGQRLGEVFSDPEAFGSLQALVVQLPSAVVRTFEELWAADDVPLWPQRAREYNGHPQQVRAIAWLEGRLALKDLLSVFERSRQRDREAIAELQRLEREASPEIRQQFSAYWEA